MGAAPPPQTHTPCVAAALVAVARVPGGSRQTPDLSPLQCLPSFGGASSEGLPPCPGAGLGEAGTLPGWQDRCLPRESHEKVQLGLGVPPAQPHTLGGQWLPLRGCVVTGSAHPGASGPKRPDTSGQGPSVGSRAHPLPPPPHPARGGRPRGGPSWEPRSCCLRRAVTSGLLGVGRPPPPPPGSLVSPAPGAALLPPGTVLRVNSRPRQPPCPGEAAAGCRRGAALAPGCPLTVLWANTPFRSHGPVCQRPPCWL